jgi:PHD/YefM family antitoxin component YafN of YafNO toxin-antitoxin module
MRGIDESQYHDGERGMRRIMDMTDAVPAAEFTRNFGRYKLQAQHEAVAVSSRGTIAGYFVSAREYEELRRLKDMRRSFTTVDLSDEKIAAIAAERIDPKHDHPNKLLDESEPKSKMGSENEVRD